MRADLLERFRTSYPNFDKFLYQGFAPSQTLAGSDDETTAWLSWIDRGCR